MKPITAGVWLREQPGLCSFSAYLVLKFSISKSRCVPPFKICRVLGSQG